MRDYVQVGGAGWRWLGVAGCGWRGWGAWRGWRGCGWTGALALLAGAGPGAGAASGLLGAAGVRSRVLGQGRGTGLGAGADHCARPPARLPLQSFPNFGASLGSLAQFFKDKAGFRAPDNYRPAAAAAASGGQVRGAFAPLCGAAGPCALPLCSAAVPGASGRRQA
jgi:hypothetical protein